MHRPRFLVVVAAMIVLSACQSAEPDDKKPSASKSVAVRDTSVNLASLTPYPAPKDATLEAPDGYEPVFVQNVARHGARSLTGDDLIEDAIELWDEAKQAGALTKAGKRFGPDARALRAAMDKVGFGDLSTLGKEEMQAIGAREGKRLATLFEKASADGAKVDVFDSGRGRAEESAENFSIGLSTEQPGLDIEPPEADEKLLKFDNEDDAYEDFLDDGPWKDGYNRVRGAAKVDEAAATALEHLFTKDFVAGIDKPLYYADALFDVYRSGPAMSRDVNVDSLSLIPRKAADAFALIDDARYFYSRGPGEKGENGSYRAAEILLKDFFSAIDESINGRAGHEHVAVYRFAHAEELTPFASLLQIEGADEPVEPGETYSHETNDFRVGKVAPLSGNISWVLWEKDGEHLVSVEHNERPTTVGRGCEVEQGTENFYELEELRSCFGATEKATTAP